MQLSKTSLRKIVFAASLGGGLEMYDFVLYIFFAPIIAQLFFSEESQVAGLLSTFAIFAVGYFMRPLGGLLFGHFGDKYGRKKGLVVSIMLMGLSTVLMGCLPTYQHIGLLAPILLTVLRLLQGIAVGGDLPGAITFVAEMSPNKRRGAKCSWIYFGVNFGIVLASALGALLTNVLTKGELNEWGWRVGFFSSVVILFLGLYFRAKVQESFMFIEQEKQHKLFKNPLLKVFNKANLKNLILGMAFMWLSAVIVAQFLLYMPTFLNVYVNVPLHHALTINTLSVIVFSILVPFCGRISDIVGRRWMLFASTILWIMFVYPAYALILQHYVIIGLLMLDVLAAITIGIFPAMLAELFPTSLRYSGVGISYNISFAIFAGLTPLFLTFLLHWANNPHIVVLNLIIGAVIALIATFFFKDVTRKSLP